MAVEQHHGSLSRSGGSGRGSNLITLSCPNHRQTIMSGLWDSFTKQSSSVDFNIQWGGRSISAHHFLLEMFLSPYRLLTLAQAAVDQADAVRLDSLLHFLYRGTVAVRQEELDRLLALARELNFQIFIDAVQAAAKHSDEVVSGGLLAPKIEMDDDDDEEMVPSCPSPTTITSDLSGPNATTTTQEDLLAPIVHMLEYGEAIEHDALDESVDYEMGAAQSWSGSDDEEDCCTFVPHREEPEMATGVAKVGPSKTRRAFDVHAQQDGQSVLQSTFPCLNMRNLKRGRVTEESDFDDDSFVTMRDFKILQKEFREFRESTVMRMGKISQACSAHSGVLIDREMTAAEEQLDNFCLPVNTIEGFKELNSWAATEENKNLMVTKLSKIGGHNLDAITRELMKRIIGRDLCEMLTFTGKFGQSAFKGTNMYDLVLEIVISSDLAVNATFRQIDEIIIRWLNGAKDRNRGRIKRKPGMPVIPSPALQYVSRIQPDATVVGKPLEYFCLPLHTMESFEELNLWVTDAHNKKTLFNVLTRIGGASSKRIAKGILTKLIGNDLCEHFNFTGKLGKRAIKDSKIYDLIVETIIYHAIAKDTTFRQIDVIIMRWLNGAKDRNGGRRVKRKSLNAVETVSENDNDNDEPDERDVRCVEQPLDYFSLPIHTIESFEQLLEWLTDKHNRETLVAKLVLVGGNNTDIITRGILSNLISSDLCHHVTLSGKFAKQAIKGTNLYDVIVETIYRHEVAQDDSHRDIDKIIMRWLNDARDRQDSREKSLIES